MTTQLLSFTVFFFSLFARVVSLGKRGLGQYMNEATALWAFVCVRTCVCGISILLLFLHTSCELFYAERKERQVKDDQRFIFML